MASPREISAPEALVMRRVDVPGPEGRSPAQRSSQVRWCHLASLRRRIGSLSLVAPARPAAVPVASVLMTFAVDRAAARIEPQRWLEALMRTHPVTPEVRQVVRGILKATDTPDSQALLAQLAVAQDSYLNDGDGDEGAPTTVELEVPDEVARAGKPSLRARRHRRHWPPAHLAGHHVSTTAPMSPADL